jgi:ADP-heptose:LPS heptosyltransferase
MPLENLAPILSVPGVEFVSLQYTENAGEEVAKAKDKHGWNISHDNAMNADLDQLFGCIGGLDLVITVLTSNVHFAGAMGVPTWCLTPIKAPWQFCQETMPWYPQNKLYRQAQHGQWSDVIERIANDLRAKTEHRSKECIG